MEQLLCRIGAKLRLLRKRLSCVIQSIRLVESEPDPVFGGWSSVHTHLGHACDPMLTTHPAYLALGASADARAIAYRRWLYEPLSPDQLASIRKHLAQERALGNPRFQAMVAQALNRSASVRPRGRPRVAEPG